MLRVVVLTAAMGLALAAVLTSSSEARAGVAFGADMSVGVSTSVNTGELGSGFTGRLGYRAKVGPLWLTPELGGGAIMFNDNTRSTRVFGGARVGGRGLVQPSIYGHYGYGWVGEDRSGPCFDVGGAFDLSISKVNIGMHVGYVSVLSQVGLGRVALDAPVNWVDVGMHAGLGF